MAKEQRSDKPQNIRSEKIISPWVTLVTRTVSTPHSPVPQDFHSIKVADYVAMLAVTNDGRVPLVRQYRPAMDRFTLELPSGLRDAREEPIKTAARELEEETGFVAHEKIHSLGCLAPDTGRLENRLWAFTTQGVTRENWTPTEPEMEVVLLTKAELRESILKGEFDHALHVAVVGLALVHGHFSFQP
ncbi:MAG: NUDIX hydrolase [Verrucomicrobiota bacterium]